MGTPDDARPFIVFDVLGTLVDQAGSMRRSVTAATGWNEADADHLVTMWLDDVAAREREIIAGDAEFAPSQDLDAASLAHLVAEGALPADLSAPLASASRKLEPWPDSVEGLARLAEDMTVGGLSNASHQVLSDLIKASDMRWHLTLSAEDAKTYKPDSAIYQLALAAAPAGSEPPYLVAAHAWDLRAAADAGLQTAYVPRPGGDSPEIDDHFDIYAEDLADLHRQLLG
ncbi:haloacid dehalogenase type II [Cellulosimicrobium cellulans]|uniref:haloacid dehalogenase type II n=1 Tax=Cellulosimicrobium cellulans TaxID=1710 RepID=UPI0008490B6E|nr:haloacid dehalogenase type II [Cellulosimicrobium cellulans]